MLFYVLLCTVIAAAIFLAIFCLLQREDKKNLLEEIAEATPTIKGGIKKEFAEKILFYLLWKKMRAEKPILFWIMPKYKLKKCQLGPGQTNLKLVAEMGHSYQYGAQALVQIVYYRDDNGLSCSAITLIGKTARCTLPL